jgi:DNA-binding beta-propeller fold protein YncE
MVAAVFAQTTNSKYEVTFFSTPPAGQDVWNRPRSVAADGKGSIFVIRPSGPPSASVAQTPVLIFNRAGQLQKSWGDGLFPDAHSVDFDHEGLLWITDCDTHMVYKYTREGKQLMALGKKGVAGDNKSTDMFNGPADVAVTRNGDFFVADGHYNNRVVHFSKDGEFIKIIGGTKGPGPGQFEGAHGLTIDSRGRLLILDQQRTAKNARVQVFDQSGKFIEQWTNIGLMQPTGIDIGADDTVYIADTDANSVTILKDGKVIEVIGHLQARPHSVSLDPATGVLYIADPPTSMMAGGNSSNPNAPGGFIKQIVRKK